jgi:hypothetical protein
MGRASRARAPDSPHLIRHGDGRSHVEGLQEPPIREADCVTAGDDDVLGGFQRCHPYLHSVEGD